MDIRNVATVEPEVEHNGTVPVWWLIKPEEMKSITDGGYLELANEFEVAVGGEVFPHTHPTHEFYFVMTGVGTMIIGGEEREVAPGRSDLHPAGRGAQPPYHRRPAHPLLLLRGGRQGRRQHRLHQPLKLRPMVRRGRRQAVSLVRGPSGTARGRGTTRGR